MEKQPSLRNILYKLGYERKFQGAMTNDPVRRYLIELQHGKIDGVVVLRNYSFSGPRCDYDIWVIPKPKEETK